MIQVSKDSVLSGITSHRLKEWEKLEKILLTVVSGTLVLTMSIFSDRTKLMDLEDRDWLFRAWIALSISLISLLLSYLFSDIHSFFLKRRVQKHTKEVINEIDYDYLEKGCDYYLVVLTNYLSLLTAIVGILFLTYFGFLNISP